MDQRKIIVSLSGGADSATLLAAAVESRASVSAVCFAYGSKHGEIEQAAAVRVAEHYGVSFRYLDLSDVFAGITSALLRADRRDVPEGHYHEETMRQTVVPARNMIFASVLTAAVESGGGGEVWMGMHAGDHFIYPDCTPEFARHMKYAVDFGTARKVKLVTPFLYNTKQQILEYGLWQKSIPRDPATAKIASPLASLTTPVPYYLTRTCYTADEIACGQCGACQERLASFLAAGIDDPLEYRTREILPKK